MDSTELGESEVFTNLTQALYEYGEQVRDMYKKKLLDADAKASVKLINSVKAFVAYKGIEFEVFLELEDYWKYVEQGIQPAGKYKNPGWKAYPFILKWIQVKPVLPTPDKKTGKLPTEKQLAFLITNKIVNKGIDRRPLLADSIEAVNRYYMKELVRSIKVSLIFLDYQLQRMEKKGTEEMMEKIRKERERLTELLSSLLS